MGARFYFTTQSIKVLVVMDERSQSKKRSFGRIDKMSFYVFFLFAFVLSIRANAGEVSIGVIFSFAISFLFILVYMGNISTGRRFVQAGVAPDSSQGRKLDYPHQESGVGFCLFVYLAAVAVSGYWASSLFSGILYDFRLQDFTRMADHTAVIFFSLEFFDLGRVYLLGVGLQRWNSTVVALVIVIYISATLSLREHVQARCCFIFFGGYTASVSICACWCGLVWTLEPELGICCMRSEV